MIQSFIYLFFSLSEFHTGKKVKFLSYSYLPYLFPFQGRSFQVRLFGNFKVITYVF